MNPAVAVNSSFGIVELKIPSKAEWVAVARLAVAAVASRLRFSVDEIEDIKLAIAEACTNCIQHGSDSDQIEITCEAMPEEMRVIVRDRGVALQLETVERANGFGDGSRTEELGVFLIRALMDTVEYHVHPREGTELVMTKRVTG
ncbi:MAG: anti-sigma B factor RsbW [Candidatus Velthaea sp.]